MSQTVNLPLTVSNPPVIAGDQIITSSDQGAAGGDFNELLSSTMGADAHATEETGIDGKVLPAPVSEPGNALPVQVIDVEMKVIQGLPAITVEPEVMPQIKGLTESAQQLIDNIQTSVDIRVQPINPGTTQYEVIDGIEPDLTVVSAGLAQMETDVQKADFTMTLDSAEKNLDSESDMPVAASLSAVSIQLPVKENILDGSEKKDAPATTTLFDEVTAKTIRRQLQSPDTTFQNQQQTETGSIEQSDYPQATIGVKNLDQVLVADEAGKTTADNKKTLGDDDLSKAALVIAKRTEGNEGNKLFNDQVKQFAALMDTANVNTAKVGESPQSPAFNTVISGQGTSSAPSNTAVAVPVTVPLHHPKWGDAMGERLVWMVNQGVHVAELKLNPANLGQLEVRITMNDDQANVAFSSPHMQVREAIEASLPKLRELMQDGGMTLNNTSVSDQSPREQRHANHAQTTPQSKFGTWDEVAEGEANLPVVAQPVGRGMIDTYV